MEPVLTQNAPKPGGHYSQAMIWNDLIFVSGQLPINPHSNEKINGSIEDQCRQTLENLKAILEDSGSGLDQVLKTTVYISDIELWGKVNEIYSSFFANHKPARAIVPVNTLHYGFQIEIEAIAIRKK